TPERTPLSTDVALGAFGVASFFNNEQITAATTDVFSYCALGDPGVVVFRDAAHPQPRSLALLPEEQTTAPQGSYSLGLAWDFPFLVRLSYQNVLAGTGSAYSLTIPFGVAMDAQAYEGASLWEQSSVALADVLLQCSRFCDHPTFDSAGVYNAQVTFRDTYAQACYRPRFPQPGDGGFPRDP
ncbi:MAG TPA: hypothetical protein VFH51_06485, partial [Myxococcota bacterium]|nr:hypothetical protein [Myxococcota bacterium]